MLISVDNVFLIFGVTILLGLVPRLLDALGVFKWLGRTTFGSKVSTFFGSKEPTDFVRGFFVVFMFLMLGVLFWNGITTKAIMYDIHEKTITQQENCKNDFRAVQVGLGEWAIICNNNSVLGTTNFIPQTSVSPS